MTNKSVTPDNDLAHALTENGFRYIGVSESGSLMYQHATSGNWGSDPTAEQILDQKNRMDKMTQYLKDHGFVDQGSGWQHGVTHKVESIFTHRRTGSYNAYHVTFYVAAK